MKYKTKHSVQLVNYLKDNEDKHLTILEIQKALPDIPVATLYRLMDDLLAQGVVRKYVIGPNQSCCFQYVDCLNEHRHFHLICEKCGKLIHLECGEVNHLLGHIEDEHGFKVDVTKVNLYGLCEDCKNDR